MAALSVAAAQTSGSLLRIDLSDDNVNITTGFNGARLALFGVKKQEGELAIVVKGPLSSMVVRRKDQIMGIWANSDSLRFRHVPVYYDLAVSRGEQQLAHSSILKNNGIGLDALDFAPATTSDDVEFVERFKEALIRNKQKQGHFPLEPKNITFLDDDFFRVDFTMPADVPTGEYQIKTYLFQDGVIQDINETSLKVAQVGFSAKLYRFAHYNAFAYGIVAILFAILAGGAAYVFLRRE